MKIIIIGAGELGSLLAKQLCGGGHDVTMIDSRGEEISSLHDHVEFRMVEGSATDPSVLKSAGAASADILLALSGDEAVNAIACRMASTLGVKRTICRLYSGGFLLPEEGISPELFGITGAFSPPEECARKILDVLRYSDVIETIRFSHPDARMTVMNVTPSSPLAGSRLKDLSSVEVVRNVRLAALVRGSHFLIPHGDTIIVPKDRVYVSGKESDVEAFIDWAAEEGSSPIRKIVLSGASDIGMRLAPLLGKEHYDVRLIEPDPVKAQALLDLMPQGFIAVQGSPTDEDAMREAGADTCDAFISTADNDESGILSCLLARQYGAKKVIAVTHKSEYIGIVPSLREIDCAFNATLVSLNTVFRLMESGSLRIYSKLHRFQARLSEMVITENSSLAGVLLCNAALPKTCVLSLIFRGNEVLCPSGNTKLLAGDTAVMVLTPEAEKEIQPFFPQGRIRS